MFTKRQLGCCGGYWGFSLSGNCCIKLVKEKVLESYKNGILSAKLVKADKDARGKAKSFARGK